VSLIEKTVPSEARSSASPHRLSQAGAKREGTSRPTSAYCVVTPEPAAPKRHQRATLKEILHTWRIDRQCSRKAIRFDVGANEGGREDGVFDGWWRIIQGRHLWLAFLSQEEFCARSNWWILNLPDSRQIRKVDRLAYDLFEGYLSQKHCWCYNDERL